MLELSSTLDSQSILLPFLKIFSPPSNNSALTINGLAPRGNPILGLSRIKENSSQVPYTTLIYGNGPGNQKPRSDPTVDPNSTDSPYYVQYAAIHQEEAFHDGSDVAIFAAGPFAHLFQGVQEQSYIAHVFAYAMCIGDYINQPHCQPNQNQNSITTSNSLHRSDQILSPDSSTNRLAIVVDNDDNFGRTTSATLNRAILTRTMHHPSDESKTISSRTHKGTAKIRSSATSVYNNIAQDSKLSTQLVTFLLCMLLSVIATLQSTYIHSIHTLHQ